MHLELLESISSRHNSLLLSYKVQLLYTTRQLFRIDFLGQVISVRWPSKLQLVIQGLGVELSFLRSAVIPDPFETVV